MSLARDISSWVRRGEVIAFLGPDGDGRTTPAYILGGFSTSRTARSQRARWEAVLPVFVEVRLTTVEPMHTAVVAATTTWTEFPSIWGPMLDKVWALLRTAPQSLREDGHNVMLYRDDTPDVEVGVVVTGPFVPAGGVKPSLLPGGMAATATHRGPIGKIGETHDAVVAWCASHGQHLTRVRWEVYGDPDASGQFSVDVYWEVLAPT